MPDILKTSLSGLVAFQRALAVTGNNIANANTDGYSRQRVELGSRPPEAFGNGFVGAGVDVVSVRRYLDQFAVDSLRESTGQLGQASIYADFAARVDNVLGDPNAGMANALQGFFNGWQTVANDPASITNRQLLIGDAQTLSNQFQQTSARLASISTDLNAQIGGAVKDVNSFAASIATLNEQIATASAAVGGQPANDLLDKRDQLLLQLGKAVDIKTTTDPDGSVNVFVGSGQPLVIRGRAAQLAAVPSVFDASRLDVAYVGNGSQQTITSSLTGGTLGGLVRVQAELIDPARAALGRIAVGVAQTVNAQQAQGIDLRGQFGTALFTVPGPSVYGATTNSAGLSLAATVTNVGALTSDDYQLRYSGGAWTAQVVATGQVVPLTGAGTVASPFQIGGVSLVVAGTPASGDSFLVRPTQSAAAQFAVATTDPRALAAATPVRAAQGVGNTGTGTISAPTVLDVTNAALMTPATIAFVTSGAPPALGYTINGGPVQAYTAGANIAANGWQLQIGGQPRAGDTFSVQPNTSGVGDNRNALAMAGFASRGVLNGGSTGLSEGLTALVADVGSNARQANLVRDAQASITNDANAAVQTVSGVNLDEEAADLLRWQQAYGAAAKVVNVADEMFRTLLSALGG